MKITCNKIAASKFDDIRKQRDEYDAETQRLEDKLELGSKQYRSAIRSAAAKLESAISNKIGSTTLDLQIDVDDRWDDGWKIRVDGNRFRNFDNKSALTWDWSVELNNKGEVKKDSGSYSGLKAITADQIADLEESVRILKVLNNIDWFMLLKEANSNKPKWEDFQDAESNASLYERRKNRPKFDEQLQAEQIGELIGTSTALKLSKDQYYNGTCYILPTSVSDKYVTGYIFPAYMLEGGYGREPMTKDEIESKVDIRRTAKTNLVKDSTTGEYATAEVKQ